MFLVRFGGVEYPSPRRSSRGSRSMKGPLIRLPAPSRHQMGEGGGRRMAPGSAQQCLRLFNASAAGLVTGCRQRDEASLLAGFEDRHHHVDTVQRAFQRAAGIAPLEDCRPPYPRAPPSDNCDRSSGWSQLLTAKGCSHISSGRMSLFRRSPRPCRRRNSDPERRASPRAIKAPYSHDDATRHPSLPKA